MLATIQVPQDQPSIQAGIDAAQNGDLVLVAPGTYSEQLTLQNKSVTLASQYYTTGDQSFIDQTIIDGGNNTVITVLPSVGVGTQIIGFTIQNGGDGINADATVDIFNNRFTDNSDAIDFEGGSGNIRNNVFDNNSDDAIDLDGSTAAVIENNIILDQDDDGIEIRLHAYTGPTLNIVIRNNRITGSGQDGIQLIDQAGDSDRSFLIEGNLIQGSGSAGLGLMDQGDTLEDFRAASITDPIHLLNNTFVDNPHAVSGGDSMVVLNNIFINSNTLALKNVDGNSIASHNLFWNNGVDHSGSNFDTVTNEVADPVMSSDYQLQVGSPAIDAGTAFFQWNGEVVLDMPLSAYSGSAPDLGMLESGSDPILYLVNDGSTTLPGGLNVENEDIVAFNGFTYSMIFDGSDLGLDAMQLDAIKIIESNEILMSFASGGSLPGISGTVDDSDIVKFSATQLGDITSGTFEMFFDGSDVGLESSFEDIDAIEMLDDGRILISTTGDFSTPQVSGTENDIIAFTSTSLGDTTAGTWALYFDGSDVGLSGTGVDGIHVDATGAIYLTVKSSFSVPDLSGKDEDVFVFSPTSLGDTTAGTYSTALFFDGNLHSLGGDVKAIDISSIDTPSVTVDDVTATEGGGLLFTVMLDTAVQNAFDVTINFTDISANGGVAPLLSPSDYANDTVTLTFAGTAGETQQFTVATLDDAMVEDSETFTVNLSATNGTVDTSDTAIGTIVDNDIAGTVFETQVLSSSDDAEERLSSGSMSLASSDLDMVYDATGSRQDHLVGMRFAAVDVPPGATILNAYIQFQADETSLIATSLTIQGEDTNDALTFSSTSGNISSRPTTASAVSWTPGAWNTVGEAGPDQRTPNIASIIQDIVNRSDWSSGNALGLIVTGTGERVAEAFDGNAAAAPRLYIEYDAATPGVTVSGTIDVAEGSLTDSYIVVLDSVPTANVDILVTPDSQTDLGAGAGTAIVLTFTPENAQIPQSVNVTAVDDAVVEGPHTSMITHTAASTDTNYDGVLVDGVIAGIADNDSDGTVFETQVSASSDDAEERLGSGSMSLASADLDMVYDATGSRQDNLLGMRFTGVDVPLGATILNAYIQFQADEASNVATTLTIQGEDTNDALTFSSTSGNISSRPTTASAVSWTPGDWDTVGAAGPDQRTPNIASVIQDIVSRQDWSSGNALGIIITGSGERVAEAFDGNASAAPRLHIEFDTPSTPAVLVGAGDIAGSHDEDEATAQLLDNIAGTVFTLGDNVYPDGTAQQFDDFYDPTWGRHKGRTLPVVGNHDYDTPDATGYYNYFGAAAGDPDKGYYSYDLGDWHIVALNTECHEIGGCGPSSPQALWLQADLAANPSECTLALTHKPRFSSGLHGSSSSMDDFWQILYDAGADVVLSGHEHDYERFAPQDPAGNADPLDGIRQFVVGTGGTELRPFATIEPNSEVRNSVAHGVLKLTLNPTGYDWEFVPIAGQTFTDSGSASCNLTSGNRAPNVTAGPDQTVTLEASAMMDGTVSDDGQPDPPGVLATTWTQVSGPAAVTFADPAAVDTTVTFSDVGTYVLRLTADDGEQTALDEVTITVNAAAETNLYLSLQNGATLPGGLTVDNEDIVAFDGTDFSIFFDGSDVGISGTNVDAIAVISANEILFSFVSAETIPGIPGTVEDSDIVKFTATGLGEETSGTFELFFRGGDVGLAPETEDIVAIDLHDDGRLLVSTKASFAVPGVSGRDEDIIAFTPDTPGDYSSGTWEMYLDGSDVELGAEDVNSLAVNSNGDIHLSTISTFEVTGVSGENEDAFVFTPSQLGNVTAGTFGLGLLFDGSQFGLDANDVNAIDLPISGPAALHGSPTSVLTNSTSPDEVAPLTREAAESLVSASQTLWASALGVQSLPDVRVEIADLPRGLLGTAENGTITLDVNADGTGWFVDATPLDNAEFAVGLGGTSLLATAGSAAAGRYDLLTAVVHEMGHLLGFQHTDGDHLMAPTLSTGVRLLPSPVPTADQLQPRQHGIDSLMALAGEDRLFIDTDPLALKLPSAFSATLNDSSITKLAHARSMQGPIHDVRWSDERRRLSMSKAASNQIFAVHANRHRVDNADGQPDELFSEVDHFQELLIRDSRWSRSGSSHKNL